MPVVISSVILFPGRLIAGFIASKESPYCYCSAIDSTVRRSMARRTGQRETQHGLTQSSARP